MCCFISNSKNTDRHSWKYLAEHNKDLFTTNMAPPHKETFPNQGSVYQVQAAVVGSEKHNFGCVLAGFTQQAMI